MDAASLYNSVNILSMRKKTLRDFLKKCESVKPLQGRLLDVGCGDGAVTQLVQHLLDNPEVHIAGCDVSEDMIGFAKKNFKNTGIEFFVLDIESSLPIKLTDRYDYVISSFVFHWVHDQKRGISNIYSLLRHGGECLLTFLPKATHFTTYREMALRPRWSLYMRDVERIVSPYQDCEDPAKELRGIMEQCGFRDVEVTCFERLHNQGTVESLRSLLRSINPFLKRVPDHEKDEYMDDLMETYMKCTGLYEGGRYAAGGPVYYPYHFLKAVGTK